MIRAPRRNLRRGNSLGRYDWIKCQTHGQSYPTGSECVGCKAEREAKEGAARAAENEPVHDESRR